MTSAQPKLADLSVLIADGNQHHRAITSEILRAAGFTRIFTAENSSDALAETRMWQPRVLIIEWALQPVDGITLTKRIRRGEPGIDRTVPIIMLTARNTVSDVETARLAGVHEYAIKPVSSAALLTRMEAAALRPRRFVDSPVYVGPCRRRKKNDNYQGPRRRLADPVSEEIQHVKAAESVTRITALTENFNPANRQQVRAVYDGARDAKAVALEIGDHPLDRSAELIGEIYRRHGRDRQSRRRCRANACRCADAARRVAERRPERTRRSRARAGSGRAEEDARGEQQRGLGPHTDQHNALPLRGRWREQRERLKGCVHPLSPLRGQRPRERASKSNTCYPRRPRCPGLVGGAANWPLLLAPAFGSRSRCGPCAVPPAFFLASAATRISR